MSANELYGWRRVSMSSSAFKMPLYLEATAPAVHCRSAVIDGVKIFCREAGRAEGDIVLLLHGFPTSSQIFGNLIPALAHRYRVITPDDPGHGNRESGIRVSAGKKADRVSVG
jgi:alpha-beta hydrolase superfamily lysophospholipase